MKILEPVQATKVRQNFSQYFKQSWTKPILITSARSWNRILIELEKYNKLLELIEELSDKEWAKQAQEKEVKWSFLSTEESEQFLDDLINA